MLVLDFMQCEINRLNNIANKLFHPAMHLLALNEQQQSHYAVL